MISKEANSLYIHIPYCKNICSYCDFSKKYINFEESLIYILDLIKDINSSKKKYKTIYIGGGTPSCLDNTLLELLLKSLSRHLKKDYEFTIESNIEDINIDKLKIYKKFNINRLSIGVQTFNDECLKLLNRNFNSESIKTNIKLAKKYISNINVDLIYGGFYSNFEILKDDLNQIVELNPTHISIYSLQINKNTLFYNKGNKELDQDELYTQYKYICSYLKKHHYIHYEISNFSKRNYYSKHNMTYWKNDFYDALGAGASGYKSGLRYKYTSNVIDYIKNKTLVENEIINIENGFEYQILLNLRTRKGINIKKISEKFKINFLLDYKNKLEILEKNKFIKIEKNFIKLTSKCIYIEEEIVKKILF